jgi:hypothetical protein
MAGVVTSVLTDKELDLLIEGLDALYPWVGWVEQRDALRDKLAAWRRSLECTGGRCDG